MEKLVDALNEVFRNYGYALTFKDVCQMFYEQGYIDTFCDPAFEEYYTNIFGKD